MSKKCERLSETVVLIILFLFALSFLNLSGYIFTVLILAFFLLSGFRLAFSSVELWLLFFSVSYFFAYSFHFGFEVEAFILYCVGPWSAHTFGRTFVERAKYRNTYLWLILVISFGMYVHGLLNVVAYVRSDYFLFYGYYRQAVDFWRGELVNVKTTEMLYVFATGISLGCLFFSYKNIYRIFSIVVCILSFALSVFLANRGLLVVMVVVFFWCFFLWLKDGTVKVSKKTFVLLIGLVCMCMVIAAILFNIAGVGDWITQLKIVQRADNESGMTRFDIWRYFFEKFRNIMCEML